MSRIEEALKRAAANTGGPAPQGPAPDPMADVFRDPWAVADDVERDTVTAAPPEPEAPPVDVPLREARVQDTAPPPPRPVPPVPVQTVPPTPPPVPVQAAPPLPPPQPVQSAPLPPPVPVQPKAQTPPQPVQSTPLPQPVPVQPKAQTPPQPVPSAPLPLPPPVPVQPKAQATSEPRRTEPQAPEVPADAPSLALFQGFDPSVAEKIVAAPDIRPAFVEQYRKLAGVLHHQQLGTNIKVVMVTSAVAGEGKSLTATNLSLTFSESYRRNVLLIDGDLRRPTLHETFQVPNTSGLGDGLRAEREEKLSLVQVSPRLTLLTAGRPDPDPMSGLTSERMRRVIDEAATRFEWIIIDTPPVGLLPDARLLAEMADTTLLVINAGRTPYPFIRRAIDAIGRERIFGVVLNRAEMDALTAGYHYYRYYDSYSREGEESNHPVRA